MPHEQRNAPVEVVEEADEVEAELDEAFLLVPAQRPEYLRRIQQMILIRDSVGREIEAGISFEQLIVRSNQPNLYSLLCIEGY